MKKITPTIPFREFKKRGYTFQRLFAFNYNTYRKIVGHHKIWVWQREGGSVEVEDWYGHTYTIVKFAWENRDLFQKSKYLRIMFNRDTKSIERYDIKKAYNISKDKLEDTGYYDNYDQINFLKDGLEELVKELKEISDFI